MCAATQSFGVVCLRRGEGTGLLGVFGVTTQGNVAETLRRGVVAGLLGVFAVTTQGNVAESLRRGGVTGLLGVFGVTTQGNVAETLRRGERESETGKKEEEKEKEKEKEEVVERESAGNVLSVSGLMVVACCFQKQAYTLNVLSCSELGADVSKVHEIAIFGYGVTMVPCAS